jgi:hypothetical protein
MPATKYSLPSIRGRNLKKRGEAPLRLPLGIQAFSIDRIIH